MAIKEILGIALTIAVPVIVALLGFLVYYLCKKIAGSTENEFIKSLMDEIKDRVNDAVVFVNQTYVNALKKEGKFDLDAQKQAFNTAYQTIIETLSAEALDYIEAISGDSNKFLEVLIEKNVFEEKPWNWDSSIKSESAVTEE